MTNVEEERTPAVQAAASGQADRPTPAWQREALQAARLAVMQPGFWWRATLALAVAIILSLGLLHGILFLAEPLAVLVLGLTLASALAPPVRFLNRWLPRALAIVVVYLSILLLLALIFYFTVPPLVQQIQSVSMSIPNIVGTIQPLLDRFSSLSPGNLISDLTSNLSQFASSLLSVPVMIARGLVDLAAVIFISIYALIEAPAMGRFTLSLVPPGREERLAEVLRDMIWEMGGYLRGAFLDGVIIGLSTYVGLLLLGVNFPLVLSLFAGLMEIVPAMGPIVATIPILLVALLQSPTKALFSLILMVGIHQFEGNIVFPNVMRSQTSISPLLVLVALLGGYAIGGPLGALTAIPVVAVSRVFLLEVVAPAIRRQTGAPEPQVREPEDKAWNKWIGWVKQKAKGPREKENNGTNG